MEKVWYEGDRQLMVMVTVYKSVISQTTEIFTEQHNKLQLVITDLLIVECVDQSYESPGYRSVLQRHLWYVTK